MGALTEEEFKGKLLVILAGYDEDMEQVCSAKFLFTLVRVRLY